MHGVCGPPCRGCVLPTRMMPALRLRLRNPHHPCNLPIAVRSHYRGDCRYNSVGTIDGNAINKLNLVVNLTRHIHVKAMVRDEEDSGLEFSEYAGSTNCFVDHVLPLWLCVRTVLDLCGALSCTAASRAVSLTAPSGFSRTSCGSSGTFL